MDVGAGDGEGDGEAAEVVVRGDGAEVTPAKRASPVTGLKGVSSVVTASPSVPKIRWRSRLFFRGFRGGRDLVFDLCPDFVNVLDSSLLVVELLTTLDFHVILFLDCLLRCIRLGFLQGGLQVLVEVALHRGSGDNFLLLVDGDHDAQAANGEGGGVWNV